MFGSERALAKPQLSEDSMAVVLTPAPTAGAV